MTYTYVILTWDRCCLVMTVLSAITSRIRKYFREKKPDIFFVIIILFFSNGINTDLLKKVHGSQNVCILMVSGICVIDKTRKKKRYLRF